MKIKKPFFTTLILFGEVCCVVKEVKGKSKVFPLQARCGPEGG